MLTYRQPFLVAVLVAFVIGTDATSAAQPPAQSAPAGQATARPDANKAGDREPAVVSLSRIRRLLREAPPPVSSWKSSLLKLDYYIEVVGSAPAVDFFRDFHIGPATAVQYGGMTHKEFLRLTAPPWRKWQ